MARSTTLLVCVVIVLCMMVSSVYVRAATKPNDNLPNYDQLLPLNFTAGHELLTTQQLEAKFPKYDPIYNTTITPAVTNSTTNETISNATTTTSILKYSTTPHQWCNELKDYNTILGRGNYDIYSIRTGYPPVCVIFYAQLRAPIPVNLSLPASNLDQTYALNPANPNATGWQLYHEVFYPQVDTFSLLEVLYSNYYFTISHVAIQIPGFARTPFAMLQDVNGTEIPVYSPTGEVSGYTKRDKGFVVPFMTALIELEDGKPKNVTWDQGCDTCGIAWENGCINYEVQYDDTIPPVWTGNCGNPSTLADGTNTQGYPEGIVADTAGLKIYLGWLGTDSNKKYCTSADKRFSQFRKYSLHSAYESAANAVQDQSLSFPDLPTANYGS